VITVRAVALLALLAAAAAAQDAPADAAPAPAAPAAWTRVDLATRAPPLIDEETAKKLFAGVRSGKRQKWDPLSLQCLKENTDLTFKWEEHAGGVVTMKTNNLGLRRDTDTNPIKSCVRVFVAGDSHTDGLVNNSESFCTLCENRLNAQNDGKRYEVLNAGIGGAGPHVYLGMLRRALFMQPDVFVAVLYVGNDFMDALFVQDWFSHRQGTKLSYEQYQKPLDDALKKWKETSLVGNSFNQAYRYKMVPDEEPIALAEVVATFDSMAKICADNKIRFVIGVIPTKYDVDENDGPRSAEIMADLGLQPKDMDVNVRLRTGFDKAMREHGATVLDPTDEMKSSQTQFYWLRDHHLDVDGNTFYADKLYELLQPLLKDVPMPAAAPAKGGK